MMSGVLTGVARSAGHWPNFAEDLNRGAMPVITDTTQQTKAVFDHHRQALWESIDETLSDYTEQSVIFTPDGPVTGLAGIRAFFEAIHAYFASLPRDVPTTHKLIRRDIQGEYVFQVFSLEPFVLMASDTFVIRGGKIVMQVVVVCFAPHQPGFPKWTGDWSRGIGA